MFTTFSDNSACIMPVCYHPTTTLLVDDDLDFIKNLSQQLDSRIITLAYTDPERALRHLYEYPYSIFRKRFLKEQSGKISIDWEVIRQEIYNPNRFDEIMTNVIDYDMPNRTGFDFMKDIQSPIGIPFHSYILLTGTPLSAFNKDFLNSREVKELISKFDSDYLTKLEIAIKNKNAANFQWFSYDIARTLSLDPSEKTSFLFEGNFLPILNQYIKDSQICELYLFDKQGSFLFLDDEANLSWLFVRNQQGVDNTVRLATRYHAPSSVIDALRSKEKILTLYEPEDFQSRDKPIHWDDYLLPSNLLPMNDHYTKFFHLEPAEHYYAFTNVFPEHGIRQNELLPYKTILENNKK